MFSFEGLALHKELVKAIYAFGYLTATELQRLYLPQFLAGSSMTIQAPSGTGKTSMFCIGMLNKVQKHIESPQCLLLSPTRELAAQSHEILRTISKGLGISTALCDGSSPATGKKARAHIVSGTPGRILSMLRQGYLDPSQISVVVCDEADMLVAGSVRNQVFDILKETPDAQKICISATLTREAALVCRSITGRDESTSTEGSLNRENIRFFQTEYFGADDKKYALFEIYAHIAFVQCMVFVDKKDSVLSVAKNLVENGFETCSVHAGTSAEERHLALRGFIKGKYRILVTTDLLARGIDVKQVSLVVHYGLPRDLQSFVHRSGRCGRFGREGTVVFLCRTQEERSVYRKFTAALGIAPTVLGRSIGRADAPPESDIADNLRCHEAGSEFSA